jgi:hypothetical protein
MLKYRTISVHGACAPNTVIQVTVDGEVCQDGPVTNSKLYEFSTPVEVHGALAVTIKVLSGKITIGDCYVEYPALFDSGPGTVTFPIPMNPIAKVADSVTQYPEGSITIAEAESFSYDHLVVNGPNYWNLTESRNIPVFEYEARPASHKDNLAFNDLVKYLHSLRP